MQMLELSRKAPVRFILLAAVAGALLAGLIVTMLPTTYGVSLAFTIDARPSAPTADYDYGGYYDLKAAELFTDTLMGWFATPSVIGEMYARAGIEASEEELAAAPKRFRAKRFSSQSVLVSYRDADRDAAVKLAAAAVEIVKEKSESLNVDEAGESLFLIRTSEPVISEANPPPVQAAGLGFLAGAFLALAFLFFHPGPPKIEQL